MADLSDVSAALVTLAAAAVYPSGTGSPSVCGTGVRVYAGWPNAQQLDTDLAQAICHVSVYPRPEERNTTRFAPTWQPVSINTQTLTVAAVGQAVAFGGTVPPAGNPHNVAILANGAAYVYAVQTGDTLAGIAAALAALVAVGIPGTVAAGAVVTLPASARLNAARVGVTGSSMREVRRQERSFQIGVWADTPGRRDAIAQAIDSALAFTTFVTMPDSSAARLTYKNSVVGDQFQKDKLYRRDLMYSVEYATTQTELDTQITQQQLNVSAAIAGVAPFTPISTTYF